MGDLQQELASLCRIARPVEFDSACGTLVRGRHPAVTDEVLQGQHPVRAWEYSQALRALERWEQSPRAAKARAGYTIADIGGAGSHFWQALAANGRTLAIDLVDPAAPVPDEDGVPVELLSGPHVRANQATLAQWAAPALDMREVYHAVFCLSVIEHVEDVGPFLNDLRSLVRPGGLLVLTCDCGPIFPPDIYHFYWMRRRIFTPAMLWALAEISRDAGFQPLDPFDVEYRGPTVYDYTVASLAFVRKDRDV